MTKPVMIGQQTYAYVSSKEDIDSPAGKTTGLGQAVPMHHSVPLRKCNLKVNPIVHYI